MARMRTGRDLSEVLDGRRRALALDAELGVVEAQKARGDEAHAREHRLHATRMFSDLPKQYATVTLTPQLPPCPRIGCGTGPGMREGYPWGRLA